MTEHKSQAELLNLYLEALDQNPQADIPTGLNEKLAAFARRLIAAEAVDGPERKMQQRVWEKMMVAAQKPSGVAPTAYSPNGHFHSSHRSLVKEEMMNTSILPRLERRTTQPKARQRRLSLAAAAVVLVLFAAVVLFAALPPNDDETIGAVGMQASETLPPQILTATETADANQNPVIGTSTPAPINPTPFTLPAYQPTLIPLEVGASVEGTVSGDEPAYYYLIQGRAGDLLMVTINASDKVNVGYVLQNVPPVGSGNGDAGGGGGGGGGGGDPSGQPMTYTLPIPVTENAAIVFMVENKTNGSPVTYTIELEKAEIPLLAYGETVLGTYAYDNPSHPYLFYDFVGERGDIVDIVVRSENMDSVMTLTWKDDSTILTSDDDSGAGYNPEISGFQLPADGRYRIELYPINVEPEFQEGGFAITVSKREPDLLRLDNRVQIFVSEKHPAQVAKLWGQAGQTFDLIIEYYNQPSNMVNFSVEQSGTVLDQVAAVPYQSAGTTYTPIQILREITIPEDGWVTIFVNSDISTAIREPYQNGFLEFVAIFDIYVRSR